MYYINWKLSKSVAMLEELAVAWHDYMLYHNYIIWIKEACLRMKIVWPTVTSTFLVIYSNINQLNIIIKCSKCTTWVQKCIKSICMYTLVHLGLSKFMECILLKKIYRLFWLLQGIAWTFERMFNNIWRCTFAIFLRTDKM